jgi:hypothetical protein
MVEWQRLLDGWKNKNLYTSSCIDQSHVELFDWCFQQREICSTLEYGCGLSTLYFAINSPQHICVDDNVDYSSKVRSATIDLMEKFGLKFYYTCDFVIASLKGKSYAKWYAWDPPQKFDLVFVDGPSTSGEQSRCSFLIDLPKVTHENSLILIDDTHRDDEQFLVSRIIERGWKVINQIGRCTCMATT